MSKRDSSRHISQYPCYIHISNELSPPPTKQEKILFRCGHWLNQKRTTDSCVFLEQRTVTTHGWSYLFRFHFVNLEIGGTEGSRKLGIQRWWEEHWSWWPIVPCAYWTMSKWRKQMYKCTRGDQRRGTICPTRGHEGFWVLTPRFSWCLLSPRSVSPSSF